MCEKNLSQFENPHCDIMKNVTNVTSSNMKDYPKYEKIATKSGFAPFQYPSWKLYECVRRGRISDLNGRINLG